MIARFFFNRIRSQPRVYRALMLTVDQIPWLRRALRYLVNQTTAPVPDLDERDPFLEARSSGSQRATKSCLEAENARFLSGGYPALLGMSQRLDNEAALLLVDVSSIVRFDPQTGIQRVVRQLIQEMMTLPTMAFRVEPVYEYRGRYYFARRYTHQLLGLSLNESDRVWRPDSEVKPKEGDVFLGLDWAQAMVREAEATLQAWKNEGVLLHFVVYDLLPLQLPQYFPLKFGQEMEEWLRRIASLADTLQCISESVASDLHHFLKELVPLKAKPVIQTFPLAADFRINNSGKLDAVPGLESVKDNRVTCLMVGLLHPRKGHAQALAAFEQLWSEGVPVRLVIVGRPGAMNARLASRLRHHPQAKGDNPSLFWLESATDEQLAWLYRNSDFLLAASEGEGFGLPLIEASLYGLPILARDLGVFREVLGDNAVYFQGLKPDDLSGAIHDYIAALKAGKIRFPAPVEHHSWRASAQKLTTNLLSTTNCAGKVKSVSVSTE